ncbi:stage II sporulation protein D [Bacillus smithii]
MMKNWNPLFILLAILTTSAMIIPALLVIPFSDQGTSGKMTEKISANKSQSQLEKQSSVEVAVYRSQLHKTEKEPLEKYVAGVVASEMPADFEIEALKAQALTARTFIVKKLMKGSDAPDGADVTDTVKDQVYKSPEELKQIWGKDYQWKMKKIEEAVGQTAGKILTYNGEPILASFFSTSNGYTENSEDYWKQPIPYLKSVKSPWDKKSPQYYSKTIIPVKEFEKKLGVHLKNKKDAGTVIQRTAGNRVGKVLIAGKEFTGREIREKLGLKSADFSWVIKGDHMTITTKGYGHGVGMSQYGANGMAKEGKNYIQILQYYYQRVQIASSDDYLKNRITAQKSSENGKKTAIP